MTDTHIKAGKKIAQKKGETAQHIFWAKMNDLTGKECFAWPRDPGSRIRTGDKTKITCLRLVFFTFLAASLKRYKKIKND